MNGVCGTEAQPLRGCDFFAWFTQGCAKQRRNPGLEGGIPLGLGVGLTGVEGAILLGLGVSLTPAGGRYR
jgi:hypothetical protein